MVDNNENNINDRVAKLENSVEKISKQLNELLNLAKSSVSADESAATPQRELPEKSPFHKDKLPPPQTLTQKGLMGQTPLPPPPPNPKAPSCETMDQIGILFEPFDWYDSIIFFGRSSSRGTIVL